MTARCLIVAVAVGGLLSACSGREAPMTQEPETVPGLDNGSFIANLNGLDIHYEVHGQGPPLMVLTNSWGLSIEGVRAIFKGLEERLTMVYFDPRGMGESAPIREESDMGMAAVRADFDALRRHLGLEQVDAIGWSNGAMNLILLAAEQPEAIGSAIFVHGAASFTEEDMAAWAETYPDLIESYQAFGEAMQNPDLSPEQRDEMQRALWLEEWFPRSCADPETAAALIQQTFRDAELSYTHADYANREAPTFDARDLLPLIQARCLVVGGAHDMMPLDKAEELDAGLADSTLVVFDNSGHYAPVEEPEKFQVAVFNFLGVDGGGEETP